MNNNKHKTTCHMNSLAHAAEGKRFALTCKGCECGVTSSTIMPRVHDETNKDCHMFRPAHQDHHGANEVCNDCSCLPTIQHEEHCPKTFLYGSEFDHPCTCSRQESLDKCYLIWGEDGALTCNYNHKAGEECLVSVRQEEELREAYEKQGDIETCSKHYVKDCPECFVQEKQDWEASFDIRFMETDNYPNDLIPKNDVLATHHIIKDFIRKEKELSKEEGRRESDEWWSKSVGQEARLAVIEKIEEHMGKYYDKKHELMQFINALKTNSK